MEETELHICNVRVHFDGTHLRIALPDQSVALGDDDTRVFLAFIGALRPRTRVWD